MKAVTSLEELERLYGDPVPASLTKVRKVITPCYRRWIEASRFMFLSTVGPDGTDGSPRGDDGPVARIVNEQTIWIPDWRGNNRIDTLRNIVSDGRVSLMFLVRGSGNAVRINGRAMIAVDPEVTRTFEQKGRHPRSVIVVNVVEAYFQCAKAVLRSGLWSGENDSTDIPSAGEFLREAQDDFDAESYDGAYAERARGSLW